VLCNDKESCWGLELKITWSCRPTIIKAAKNNVSDSIVLYVFLMWDSSKLPWYDQICDENRVKSVKQFYSFLNFRTEYSSHLFVNMMSMDLNIRNIIQSKL